MHKASWVFLLAVSLVLTAGCKKDELRAKDARIAELEASGQATGTSLEQCKKDKANLDKLVKGYTGEINAMEAALAEAAAREARAAKRLAEYNSMLKQLKSMIDSGKLKVRITRNKMVIELPEAVLFASGSAKLKTEGVRVLAELGPVLASLKGREFQVGGHTDNKPIRTKRFPSNWQLSGARAIDVTQLLIEYGVPGTRVSAAAYADTQPVADNDTPEGRALNRRIEIA
ncbi:MAG: flagellar motor protein MotB, partial [Myxococcales bacterium]|nr:flagellar motor protein MotB [Myxococcales bacterium]